MHEGNRGGSKSNKGKETPKAELSTGEGPGGQELLLGVWMTRVLTKAQHTLTAASWQNAAGCWTGPLGLLWVHDPHLWELPVREAGNKALPWDQSPLLPPANATAASPARSSTAKTNTQGPSQPRETEAHGAFQLLPGHAAVRRLLP